MVTVLKRDSDIPRKILALSDSLVTAHDFKLKVKKNKKPQKATGEFYNQQVHVLLLMCINGQGGEDLPPHPGRLQKGLAALL